MVGAATPSTWNFGSTGSRWSEIADFEHILARIASAVTPSKKTQLILIGSPLRASNEPKMIIVRCALALQGSSKRKMAVFGVKLHFAWRKHLCSLCENCQGQSCKL